MAKREMTIQVRRLGDSNDAAVGAAGMSTSDRLALVWTLTREAWALTNQPMPGPPRGTSHIVVARATRVDGP